MIFQRIQSNNLSEIRKEKSLIMNILLYVLCIIALFLVSLCFYSAGWNRGYNDCQDVMLTIVRSYQDEIVKLREENYELSIKFER